MKEDSIGSGGVTRVGVLSDTHLTDCIEAQLFLEELVATKLAPVDLIIHAGDLVAPGLLDVFRDCPVHAVRGNMDPASPGLPFKKTFVVGGFTIGLIHGWGPPEGLEGRILGEFSHVRLDCLVHGHSHVASCFRHDGILFFNPGSATDRRRMPFHSVGLLEIDTEIRGKIIRLDQE